MRPRVRTHAFAHVVRATCLTAAAIVIWRQATTLHWTELAPLLHSYRWPRIALALAFTALSFLLLGAIEILALGVASSGGTWRVPPRRALLTAFVSHAFSQSLGVSLVTGTAVRVRAYAAHGLNALTVARVTALVTVAISLGLLTLGAAALVVAPAMRPGGLRLPSRAIAVALGAIVTGYLGWMFAGRRAAATAAAAQIGLSAFDWYLTATILFLLLPPASPFAYLTFVAACVLAHGFGMLSHVPGGAGVFEATMFSVLAVSPGSGGRAALAASLVAYRIVYYVIPLAAATVVALRDDAHPAPRGLSESPVMPSEDTAVRTDPAVDWVVDNAGAYDALLRAIDDARGSIWVAQLAFDADCLAYGPDGKGRSIAAALVAAATRGVDVRIILNETFLLDTAKPVRRYFARALATSPATAGTINVRGVSSFPRLLHAKIAIVDGTTAFLLGSPFVNGYWDDAAHRPIDARRPKRELGGRPLHDLTIRVGGDAVADLERVFMELWTGESFRLKAEATGSTAEATGSTAEATGSSAEATRAAAGVRVVSTFPRGVIRGRPEGSTEILDVLVEGIASARSLIYIEHQYLSSRRIVAALAEALRRHAELEIIAVLNENADVTAYRRWQVARLGEAGLLTHPRVGLFALWTAGHSPTRTLVNQVFVHSKVVVVDDAWVTAGSANLDGVSLHSYGDDFSGVGRRVFRHTRNVDVNLVITGPSAGSLRPRLWSEHFAMPGASLVDRPSGGWLPLWRARATANVRSLQDAASGGSGRPMNGFILPYSIEATPARQLAALGVSTVGTTLEVCFNPGWLEVHFSPNWVRNMFS